ncbi:MAG TPA: heparan-alpha-glucosaminide N-acetyltransferase domain-containing protein [Pirellulales bacterium]|nr:heparan-alpha-glucosaminide N-acetyltransferase domain-containing protein [Pirellulales bacterium]
MATPETQAASPKPPASKPAATQRPGAPGSERSSKPATGRAPERLVSLDAYRGFIMLAMASGGFAVANVFKANESLRDSETWRFLAYQLDHVAWTGCACWDLIQPSFMFMVGVSMAYSYASRQARGQSYPRMLGHAVYRSLVLVALGVFLTSNWDPRTNFVFTNVLCQIGLGYTFLFLLWNRHPSWQFLAVALILIGDWALFHYYPAPAEGFNDAEAGIDANWPHLQGAAAHWDKNTNVAAAADRTFLNWFPRAKRFEYNAGGYTTLNFLPSLATMIFGLLAGGLLRGSLKPAAKLAALVAAGAACLALGWSLDHYGVCPSVKRIWTPSWALFSTGWTFLMLAGFYGVIDLAGFRRAAWPLVVVGMNSIAVYCMSQLIGGAKGWIAQSLERHLGGGLFTCYGRLDPVYEPIARMVLVLLVIWLVCCWLYRQRLFARI